MISVPDAGTLPSTERPIAASNGSITSGGNPFGYKGNGSSRRMPIISQCPVVVSLPAESSVARPCAEPTSARGATPAISPSEPEPERLERGDPQAADRARRVAEGVGARVPVVGLVRGVADPP